MDNHTKCCRVIPFYFGKRRISFNSAPHDLPLAQFVCENQRKIDPGEGLTVDTVLVNNSPECELANKFFDKIDGKKTKSGKFIVINGDNVGISFGAYNKAFELFRNDYQYWAFTEDDIIVNNDGYFRKCIDQMANNQDLGFVALIGVSGSGATRHAHGGIGISSTAILERVYQKNGNLPYAKLIGDGSNRENWGRQIHEGEVSFTGAISALGYKIEKISSKIKPYVRWCSDHQKLDLKEWGQVGYIIE